MAAQCSYSEKLFPTSVIGQPAKKIEQDREHQVPVFMFWQSKRSLPETFNERGTNTPASHEVGDFQGPHPPAHNYPQYKQSRAVPSPHDGDVVDRNAEEW